MVLFVWECMESIWRLYDACFVWGFVRSGLVCMGVYGEYMEIIRRLLCMGIRKKWSCLYGSVWRVYGDYTTLALYGDS